MWRTSDFTLERELKKDHQRWVWDAAFSIDSQYLFTGKHILKKINMFLNNATNFLASSDGYANLWNVKTGQLERDYAGHQKAVTALAFRDSAI